MLESLRLARTELEQQLAATTHERQGRDDGRCAGGQRTQPGGGRFSRRRPAQAEAGVGGGQVSANLIIRDVAHRAHAVVEAVPGDHPLQRRHPVRLADQQQTGVAVPTGQRAQDRFDSLFGRDVAERDEHRGAVRNPQFAAQPAADLRGRPGGRVRGDTHPNRVHADTGMLVAQVSGHAGVVDGDQTGRSENDRQHGPEVVGRSAQPFDGVLRRRRRPRRGGLYAELAAVVGHAAGPVEQAPRARLVEPRVVQDEEAGVARQT